MQSDRSTFEGLDLHLDLGRRLGRRASLEEALREAIRSGRLPGDSRLPSTRALAADLGLARGTVTDAYDQLTAEGWLVARRGSGTRVAAAPTTAPGRGAIRPGADVVVTPRHDFRPGRGDVSNFPRRSWLAALRRALREAEDAELDYGDPGGQRRLREALAAYLGRARGLPADPTRVVVCNGWVQGFALLVEAFRATGMRCVAVEDPSMPRNPVGLGRFGLRVAHVPVDDLGADPGRMTRRGEVGAAVLTPAHQYPTGVTLSAERRAAWVAWARRHEAVLIEDDYDGEFRYDRQPVGALAALDPERVIYVGTTSKSLAPGIRLGWMVLPPRWLDAVTDLRATVDRHTGALDQLAMAELLASGAFDRHVRHARLRYRRRRDLLLALLADRVPAVTAHGIAAGLHTVIELPAGGPGEAEVVRHLARAQVAVHGLADYRHRGRADRGPALVVGFATPPEHGFAVGARVLADALAELYG
ncbi:MAG TPA: PLP-dependent aminotransferase family protein [Acidimicrobiales bacterium]|nr:PLP-dependent aminotransferase family protein [Acidimicrobiales bacterium]